MAENQHAGLGGGRRLTVRNQKVLEICRIIRNFNEDELNLVLQFCKSIHDMREMRMVIDEQQKRIEELQTELLENHQNFLSRNQRAGNENGRGRTRATARTRRVLNNLIFN